MKALTLLGLFYAIFFTPNSTFAALPATEHALTQYWSQFHKSSFPTGLANAVKLMVRSEDDAIIQESLSHTKALQSRNALFQRYIWGITRFDLRCVIRPHLGLTCNCIVSKTC
jgi:hypothetical protein